VLSSSFWTEEVLREYLEKQEAVKALVRTESTYQGRAGNICKAPATSPSSWSEISLPSPGGEALGFGHDPFAFRSRCTEPVAEIMYSLRPHRQPISHDKQGLCTQLPRISILRS
jgi:hypothetical protein